ATARTIFFWQHNREYLGLDWESQGHWDEPFFFIQIADPQLGMVKA
ncbi:unnamed protein product, partial [Ectocarpus sp. 8 AP-2014]